MNWLEDKTCTKCKTTLPLTDFTPNPLGKYGRKSVCRVCSAKGVRKHYYENRAEALIKREEYRKNNWDKIKFHALKRAKATSRLKIGARNAVARALLKGELIKENCQECDKSGRIEFHHFLGYKKENWLKGEWLCPTHHHIKHRLPL